MNPNMLDFRGMRQIEGAEDPIAIAQHNIRCFDKAAHAVWLSTRDADVRKLAMRMPPNRLYRLLADDPMQIVPAIVIGYQADAIAVHVLGVTVGLGSCSAPVFVDPARLELYVP